MSPTDLQNKLALTAARFAISLRERRFNRIEYEEFLYLLKRYREFIRNEKSIRRDIASSLHFIAIEFPNLISRGFVNRQNFMPESIADANNETWALIMEILNPEPNSPEEIAIVNYLKD